ncbi:hypothetical protein RvY_09303 [Ramazzottius varieornatus]|uniref:Uncharacterized protein n=1 Tax=Ramazzottius varieornatus TaxID=947166 RepID=A0A1D1V8V1_RAMVA|nr:hypothetical protein RvY_09303 [Ramazzottius varieornatus]
MIYPNTPPEVGSVGSSIHPGYHPSEFLGRSGLALSLYGGPEANLLGASRTTVRSTKRTETGLPQGSSQIASAAFHAEHPGRQNPELYQEGYEEEIPAQNAAYQELCHHGQSVWQGLHGPDVDQVRSSLSQEYDEPLELRTSEAFRSPDTSQNYPVSFDSLTSSAASALPPFHFSEKTELGLLYSSPNSHSQYTVSPATLMETPPQLPLESRTRQRTRRERARTSQDVESYSARQETQQVRQASSEAVFKLPRAERVTRIKNPKSFVFSHLQIGNLHIDASNEYDPDVKRLYRLKIVFSARKLMYEFESKHLSSVAVSLKTAEPRARIDVPFQYIQSLKQEGDIVTIHTFDTLQLNTYLGHREENSITHLTKYMKEPVETSSRLSSYHKLTFEPGEGVKFKSFYDEALKGPKSSGSSKSTTPTSRSSRSRACAVSVSAERSTSSKRTNRKRPASEEDKAEEDPEQEEGKPAIKRQRSTRK